jgi:hypothetical protein
VFIMTLILTVANSLGVYQSSDYMLTQGGKPVYDRAGSKQLTATFDHLHLSVAFTGVATWRVNSRIVPTTDYLDATLNSLAEIANFKPICEALRLKCDRSCVSKEELTLVVTAVSSDPPFQIATISNVVWTKKCRYINRCFRVRYYSVRKPFYLISGWRPCVSEYDESVLDSLSRDVERPRKEIVERLAEINKTSARKSNGLVSEQCLVTAKYADGENRQSDMTNFGEQPGIISQIQPGFGLDMEEIIRKYVAVPGMQPVMRQAAFKSGPLQPIVSPPMPTGETVKADKDSSSQ